MLALSRLQAKVLSPDSRIRILVVDDSVVIRRLVSQALAEDEHLEVVGTAANGAIALQRIQQLHPDVITLDIEMPEMDGLETLRQIRKQDLRLPVIMFSTLTQRGAASTLDALALGASDYVTKAANVGSLEKSMASLRSELLPKIKQFFKIGALLTPELPPVPKAPRTPLALVPRTQPGRVSTRKQAVVIGVSTGGPNALAEVMPMFPKDFPLPILIVQHMPPLFTRFLAERLNATSAIRVAEVTEGSKVEAGKALLAAGGYHMRVRKEEGGVVARMDQGPAENSCRPAVDALFRSASEVYAGGVVSVILTGMGYDGLVGVQLLKGLGAYVIAQDEPSSVVWGMPGCIVKAGLADATVDLSHVVPEILNHIR